MSLPVLRSWSPATTGLHKWVTHVKMGFCVKPIPLRCLRSEGQRLSKAVKIILNIWLNRNPWEWCKTGKTFLSVLSPPAVIQHTPLREMQAFKHSVTPLQCNIIRLTSVHCPTLGRPTPPSLQRSGFICRTKDQLSVCYTLRYTRQWASVSARVLQ